VRAREADLVDEGPVRVLQAHARELLELVERPDDVVCSASLVQRHTGSGVPQ
jgi:hypothetical protein